jgi:hypothetical protein
MLGRNVGAVVLERNSAGFLDCFIVNGLLEKILDVVCGWMVVRKRFARSDFSGTSTILFLNTNNSSRLYWLQIKCIRGPVKNNGVTHNTSEYR